MNLVSAQASAQAQGCTGKNLLKQLKVENPFAYARIMEWADRPLNGNALLWKVQKEPDGPVSHLFGTMHLTDDRLTNLPDEVLNALDGAQVVALENLDVFEDSVFEQQMLEMPELWKFKGDETLRDHMTNEQLGVLRKAAGHFRMDYFNMLKLKPWFVMSMISLPQCENVRHNEGKMFLDEVIGARARTNDAELIGLESVREQFAAMDSVPMESQVVYLVGTARMANRVSDILETIIQLYLQRKIGVINPMLSHFSGSGVSFEHAHSTFNIHFIDKRNLVMRDRSMPLLERGNAFIAVGALHLPGQGGLEHNPFMLNRIPRF